MKIISSLVLSFLFCAVYSQTPRYQVLLDSAKTMFNNGENLDQEESDDFKYLEIIKLLKEVIKLHPENAEARYFLGYSYSRANANDARSMVKMDMEMLRKTSEQFEKVIELTPKYQGETIILDPYSKLTAEWGSMAMVYWQNSQAEQAINTFKEGKKRGGFGDFFLESSRKVLDACSENALLMSSGDNAIFPLLYLQIVENYRADVTIVEASLLNTAWYPAFLTKKKALTFDLPSSVLDTIDYIKWKDTRVSIDDFSWTLKPSYYDEYLLRGDRVFLSLLKANKFKREVYFTVGFAKNATLSLSDYLSHYIVVNKLHFPKKESLSLFQFKALIEDCLKLSKYLNLNSRDEIFNYDFYRFSLLERVQFYIDIEELQKAEELLYLLDFYANEKKIPYSSTSGSEYLKYLKEQLQN